MVSKKTVAAEVNRAEDILRSLRGGTVDTLTVNSLESEDAAFLGRSVSKLSPIIGNLLERRIIRLLDEKSEHGMHWIRQDPGFPDALLVDANGVSTEAGYEVKAWYALSTELTGRFRESQNLLAARSVRIVVVAWAMSHIVYGTPTVLDVLAADAASVARARDEHYHQPPAYLCVEPRDTTTRTRNLQQTNVSGYRLQELSKARIDAARHFVQRHPGRQRPSHMPEAQSLAADLMNQFAYRLDTNFAKIDRIDHQGIEQFKNSVLSTEMRGKPIRIWARLLKALGNEKDQKAQREAARTIQGIYDGL